MQGLALLLILTLIFPVAHLVRIYQDTKTWRYNLLRVLLGDLSGLIILGSIYVGHQSIGTESPSKVPSLALSLVVIIFILFDLYRAEDRGE
jgi:hypothetical protein